jgi:hypothetical protein
MKYRGSQAPVVYPVIPATWEAEIGRIKVQGHPRQIVKETYRQKITRAKWTVGVA